MVKKKEKNCNTCKYGLITQDFCIKTKKSLDKNRYCKNYKYFDIEKTLLFLNE